MENNNRSAVLNQINALDFAMTDLNLYLDTHPRCTEALNLFKEYRTQRAEKIAEYERRRLLELDRFSVALGMLKGEKTVCGNMKRNCSTLCVSAAQTRALRS